MANHEKTCSNAVTKKRLKLKKNNEYSCRMHRSPIQFIKSKDLRIHLYLFHRNQPDIYLKKFGYKSKLITKTIQWVRISFKAYCNH